LFRNTPLHLAFETGNIRLSKLLLSKGGKLDIQNFDENYPND